MVWRGKMVIFLANRELMYNEWHLFNRFCLCCPHFIQVRQLSTSTQATDRWPIFWIVQVSN